MENSSYDELVKKIASLQAENSHLRQYVHYNSNHMTQLEQESTSMRVALSNHSQEDVDLIGEAGLNSDPTQNRGASFLDQSENKSASFLDQSNARDASILTSSVSGLLDLSKNNRSILNQSVNRDASNFNQSQARETDASFLNQSKAGILDQSKSGSLSFNQSHTREGLYSNNSQPASLDHLQNHDSAILHQSHTCILDQSKNHGNSLLNQSKQSLLDKSHLDSSSIFNQSHHSLNLDQSKNKISSNLNQSQKASHAVKDQSFLNQSKAGEDTFLDQSNSSFLDQSQTADGHEGGAEQLDPNNASLNESALRQTDVMFADQDTFRDTESSNMVKGHSSTQGSHTGMASPGKHTAMASPGKHASHTAMASPGKRRNTEREFFSFMQELDQERTAILHDIESEDKLRKWYYEQLEVFTKKIESLPLTETYNLQADMNRRQLEYELQKLRESLQDNLGSSESIATRHEARLHKIHMVEREMLRLQQRHSQLQDLERPNSGAHEAIEEGDENSSLVDASTNTSAVAEAFVPKKSGENTAHTSDRNVVCLEDGSQLVSIATQTSDVVIPDFDSLPDIPVPQNTNLDSLYHGEWPITKGPASEDSLSGLADHETVSVMSFNSSNSHGESTQSSPSPPKKPSSQNLSTKYPCFVAPQVEMVYSLLSMLGTHDKDDMSRTLLAMSSSQDSCIAMRQSGCMPLLIQLLHGSDKESGLLGNTRGSKPARARAAAALHNIVHSHPDDKRGRREARVLRLLEQIRAHCDQLRDLFEAESLEDKSGKSSDIDHHPGPAIAALMKLSFDEEHRHAICTLGGLQAIAELLEVDQLIHDNTAEQYNITMRRYACMALTNLTFGDGTNKALLCSMKTSMEALVGQLRSPNEDLCQVAASVLRNLSWRADLASKKTLREVGAVTTLMEASMLVKKESTLKSILSALWNLSAHCSENKADICGVCNALVFLVNMLTYKSPSKTLAIIENGGGILRNVSSHVAIREDYRKVLRQHGCLQILLKHLRSPSLTIVSNACGTLWNLSARCPEDQQALWDMGAVSMLKNLLHSKHKMISMGSAAALKNLLAARPSISSVDPMDKHKSNMPSLHVRKQRALEAEIDQNLSETCENVDSPRDSPVDLIGKKDENDPKRFLYGGDNNNTVFQVHNDSEGHRRSLIRGQFFPRSGSGDSSSLIENRIRSPQRVARSGSQDSVGSVHSDISHDRSRVQNMLAKSSKLLHERQGGSLDRRKDGHTNVHNTGSRSLDSASDMYRGRLGHPSSSRIMQVMKEVAAHNGLEPEYNAGDKEQENRCFMNFNSGNKNFGHNQENAKPRNFECVESVDQPINYSMKYDGDSDTVDSSKNNQNFPPSLNNRPVPKIGSYVGSAFTPQQEMPNMVRNNFPAPKNIQAERNYFNGKPDRSTENKKLNALHETDFSTDDLPTDYSRLYAEHSDEHYNAEQPMNYDSHYRDCADCKLEEARRTNDMLMLSDEDCVRTFYTEGTPLNYMSTATSMTDLNAHHQRIDANKTLMNQVPEDETHSYSTHFEKEDDTNNGLSDSVREVYNDSIQERTVVAADSESHSPSEKPKTYCEEGTPICFSRVSSLSSLHSSDARDRNEGLNIHGSELQSIDEDGASGFDAAKKKDTTGKKDELSPGSVESPEKEHKTVTWDDNHQVQETPLMFSRCSSLGSLSSFDAHSVHSSVLSDYSRRPSGNVSPSDLPDSPSETMPPTPRCKSPHRANATSEETGAEEITSEENKTDSVKAAEAEVRRDAEKRTIQLKITSDRSQREENIQMAEDLHLPEDVPKTYATEDTPLNFSETTSLSGLSIRHDDDEDEAEGQVQGQSKLKETPKPADWRSHLKQMEDRENDNNSSLSEVSEGEEDILAQCISSAMPNNSNRRMKKSASDNAIKKKVGFFKIENLNQSKSKLPTKVVNTSRAGLLSPPGVKPKPLRKPIQTHVADGEQDTLKSYATEGTPLNFSRSESLSELSMCTDRSEPKTEDPLERVAADDSKSDNSSFMEDHDDFLLEIIQSAMPKVKSLKKPATEKKSDVSDKASPKDKKHGDILPLRRQNFAKVRHASETQSLTGGDTTTTFAVEGTPINFSTATSLSDLMVDIDAVGSKPSDTEDEDSSKQFSGDTSTQQNAQTNVHTNINRSVIEARYEDSLFLTDVAACDSPRVYGMEGTPMSFSRSDSLSSLGIPDDHHEPKKQPDQSTVAAKSKLPRRANQRSASRLPTAMKSGLPLSPARSVLDSTLYQREVVGQSSEDSSQADTLHDKDQTKKFEVEGTPYCFSRNSSLSSLHTDDNLTRDNSGEGEDLKVTETEYNAKDHQDSFQVEGTPVCFSRNSSLSSLSIESSPSMPTQFEQDLLEQCISSAMPKGKVIKPLMKTAPQPRGIPRPGSMADKLPLRSPLHIRAEFDADMATPTNAFRPREGDSDVFYNSPASPLLSSINQPGHDRFTSWRRQPHKSCDEIFTSSPYDENKFNWRRSHSQDSENFLKQRKDVSNFVKAQIDSTTENADGRQPEGRFRIPFPPSMEGISANVFQMQDNRMLEETEKDKKTIRSSEELGQYRDSSSSIEKVDSEKSDSDGAETCFEILPSSKDDRCVEDTMKEPFPTCSILDTDDDLLASMEDPLGETESNETFETGGSGDTSCLNETVIHRPDAVSVQRENQGTESGNEVDQQELEANANIVVSELFIERELSKSMLDEEMFIENETISLVSNGYNSDTASEVSISWSTSSKTNSEQTSEYAASNASQNENRLSGGKGPRITKPSEKPAVEQAPKDDNTRAVRGRRKPLYPGARTSSIPGRTGAAVSDNSKIAKPNNSSFKTPWNKAPQPTAKKVSPKGQTTTQNGPMNKVSPKSKLVKPSTVVTPRPQRNGPARSVSQSKLPTTSGDKISPPLSKGKGKTSPTERPKPPIKQGTFVKESSAKNQIPRTQGNPKSDTAASDTSTTVKLRDKKTSSGSSNPPDRSSGGSSGSSNGVANGSPPEAWGKALGGYNFLVDKSQEQGLHAPYEQIQMQKNSKDCPKVLKRNNSNITKTTTTTTITVKISGNSPSGISRIATSNLRKTTSMSPSRCGSSSALNRTGSAGNLKKTGSKVDLKKSDSNASLKKVATNSRPSTPNGRRTPTSLNFNNKNQGSPNGTPTKKAETTNSTRKTAPGSIGKKQVTSKIASLWKKDDGGHSSGNSSDKSPPESRIPPRASRVPTKKPALPVKPKISPKSDQKEVTSNHAPPPREGISRSSTYDKITLLAGDVENDNPSVQKVPSVDDQSFDSSNSESPASRDASFTTGKSRLEFDSSTWKKDKHEKSENASCLPDADDTFGGSVWRRYDSDTEEDKTDIWVKHDSSKTEDKISEDMQSLTISNSTSTTSVNNASDTLTVSNTSLLSNTSFINSSNVNSSFMNASTASTASTSRRLVRNFGSSSLQKAALTHQLSTGNTSPSNTSLPNGHVENTEAKSSKSPTSSNYSAIYDSAKKSSEGRTNTPTAAIVAPFNYKPSTTTSTSNTTTTVNNASTSEKDKSDTSPGKRSLIGSPNKHMTKTEMLLARRRSYLNSVKNEENSTDGEDKKRPCLVTTV